MNELYKIIQIKENGIEGGRLMYWKLVILFGVFLLIDILGHIGFKIKRKIAEWLLLIAIAGLSICFVVLGITNSSGNKKKNGENIYMAYKYLSDGNIEQAKLKLVGAVEGYEVQASVLDAMADMVNKNYVQGYFKSQRLLSDGALSSIDRKFVQKVQTLCMNELGIGDANDTEINEMDSYEEYVKELEAQDEDALSHGYSDNSKSIEDSESSSEAMEIVDEYVNTLNFTKKQEKQYTKDYELDSKLTSTDIYEITLEDIDEIKDKYGNTEEVKKLECKYYVKENDYEQAKEKALELVKSNRNEENYVIYTDIIAQEAYENEKMIDDIGDIPADEIFDMTDKEVKNLVEKAEKIDKQIEGVKEKFDAEDEEIADKLDKLEEEADELYTEAVYVDVYRAINYIIAKEPVNGDTTGMYDLQLAKLYLVAGDRDTASEYLYKVIDNSVDISDSSAIKEALNEVVSQYNQITGDEFNAELNTAIEELIRKQSSNVVSIGAGTINGTFNSYVASSLKYDKINIHISKIDTEDYPTIKAYVNINGDKDGKSELASDFTEADFSLIDAQYEITNFNILKNGESNQVSIGIVMDHSGSMNGTPLANAKMAAESAVEHMNRDNQKISIVAYDDRATVMFGLSNKTESLKRAINNVKEGGGTNISSGLFAGLEEIKDEAGSRAIILMSDGQDGGSKESMQNAINEAVENGICVYTVAFGECDEEYMKWIADATGGKYMKASDSSDLSDIYLTLQRYIVNNYCIEYKIEKNVDTDPRYLTVSINEYNATKTKDYYLNEENKPESEEDESGIIKVDENAIGISSMSPSGVSVKEVADGMEVTMTGSGFEDGMNVVIGNIPLTNVMVEDKTRLTGTLKGAFEAGIYDVYVKTEDGKMAIANNMFKVFKSGKTKSVRLGSVTITADSIGQTGDSTLVASGNVLINGFVHSAGDMQIDVSGMNKDIDLTKSTSVYVGDAGKLSGQSKLYVSYDQMKETNGNFASLVMAGKDYIIQKNQYVAEVTKLGTTFDSTVANFDLEIPFIMDIDVAEVNLYSNRLQVDIKTFDLSEIVENFNDSINHKTGANKEEPKVLKRSEANKFDIKKAVDGGISMAITPDGIQFGGEVSLDVNDALNFGNIGVNEFSIKLNSLDSDHEYWKIGGKIDFARTIKGFASTGIEGFEGSISSYYWLPDSISIEASLNPGITVYKVIDINSIDGSMQGISTLILKLYESLVSPGTYEILGAGIDSDAYAYQDVILEAGIGAKANLFASFDDGNILFKKFKEWGEIGEINGDVSINFSEPELKIAADMNLLGSEKASAEAKINKSGLDITAEVDLSLSGFGMEVSGGADANLGGNLTGAYIGIGVNGKVKCPVLSINSEGEASVKVDFDWDFNKAAVTVNYKDGSTDKEASLWYEDNGELFLKDKIHTSVE